MKTLKNKAKKGFTIVELVIVIAVIAILAAVLIPTFSGVVTSAKETAAMEDCRNTWTEYLVDNVQTIDYDDYTYYVAYNVKTDNSTTTATYIFEIKDGEFDTDPMMSNNEYATAVDSSWASLLTTTNSVVIGIYSVVA